MPKAGLWKGISRIALLRRSGLVRRVDAVVGAGMAAGPSSVERGRWYSGFCRAPDGMANWSSSMPLGVKCVWCVGFKNRAGMCHTLSAARPARARSPSRTAVPYGESRVVEWHSWATSLISPLISQGVPERRKIEWGREEQTRFCRGSEKIVMLWGRYRGRCCLAGAVSSRKRP